MRTYICPALVMDHAGEVPQKCDILLLKLLAWPNGGRSCTFCIAIKASTHKPILLSHVRQLSAFGHNDIAPLCGARINKCGTALRLSIVGTTKDRHFSHSLHSPTHRPVDLGY